MVNVSHTGGSLISHAGQKLEQSLEVTAYLVNNTEPLDKVTKIVLRCINAANIIRGSLSESMANFNEQLINASLMFDTLKFFGNAKNVIAPDEKGRYLLTNPENSWQKCADRVTLAIHTGFKTFKGLNKFGFVSLGCMAKNAIGKLPIFQLVMDSFILASNVFGLWDSVAYNLPKANTKVKDANEKLDKWQQRSYAIELLKAGDELELQTFREDYEAKAAALRQQLVAAEGSKAVTLKAKLEKVDARIAKIAANDFTGLAADLEKTNIALKQKKWEVCQHNAQQEHTKVWIKIANAICKIVVISLALTLIATNMWAAPYALSLIALGNITDSIGLTKIILDAFWKPEPLPVS